MGIRTGLQDADGAGAPAGATVRMEGLRVMRSGVSCNQLLTTAGVAG